jgi:hypothetical protein
MQLVGILLLHSPKVAVSNPAMHLHINRILKRLHPSLAYKPAHPHGDLQITSGVKIDQVRVTLSPTQSTHCVCACTFPKTHMHIQPPQHVDTDQFTLILT